MRVSRIVLKLMPLWTDAIRKCMTVPTDVLDRPMYIHWSNVIIEARNNIKHVRIRRTPPYTVVNVCSKQYHALKVTRS